MLTKFIGASPSTSVATIFPRLVEDIRRSKVQGAKGNESMLKGIALMYFHYLV
jgi:hypothetical protein